jgi:hypothetical protein
MFNCGIAFRYLVLQTPVIHVLRLYTFRNVRLNLISED